MKKRMLFLVVLAIVFVFQVTVAKALTAEEVIENMNNSYEKQMANINDVTIISDNNIQYQKKATVDGEKVYKTRTEINIGLGVEIVTVYDGEYQWSLNPTTGDVEKQLIEYNPNEMLNSFKNAKLNYITKEKYDGFDTHVLSVKDMDMVVGADQKEGLNGKIWVDAKDWVVRKVQMEVEPEKEDKDNMGVLTTVKMKDYKRIDGMLIPYTQEISIGGTEVEMTPEEQEEMRQNIEEMEKELEQMSGFQRKLVEKMRRAQINVMKNLLEGSGIVTTMKVKDVKVNSGLSDDLFNGKLLRK